MSWTEVPLASKSLKYWNRSANIVGLVGSVRQRLTMKRRSIGPIPDLLHNPAAMSRTGPPLQNYYPSSLVELVVFGTGRYQNP